MPSFTGKTGCVQPEDVLAEAGWVFDRLIKAVHALPDAELEDPARTNWFVKPYWDENTPLWKCIAGNSYEHYRQHIPQVRSWLDAPVENTPSAP